MYSILRVRGALFAGFARAGWIAERLLDVPTPVNVLVNSVAHHAIWIGAVLFLMSLAGWSLTGVLKQTSVTELLSPPVLTRTDILSLRGKVSSYFTVDWWLAIHCHWPFGPFTQVSVKRS